MRIAPPQLLGKQLVPHILGILQHDTHKGGEFVICRASLLNTAGLRGDTSSSLELGQQLGGILPQQQANDDDQDRTDAESGTHFLRTGAFPSIINILAGFSALPFHAHINCSFEDKAHP